MQELNEVVSNDSAGGLCMCAGVVCEVVHPQLFVISLWYLLVFWILWVKSVKMDEDRFLVARCCLQTGWMSMQSFHFKWYFKGVFCLFCCFLLLFCFNSSKSHCLHLKVLDAEWLFLFVSNWKVTNSRDLKARGVAWYSIAI